MEHEELAIAKKYFEKVRGNRIGGYMSELRKQFVIRMHKQGAKSRHIKAITFLKHDQIWHYLNKSKQNIEVEKIILANMDEWITKGLYPLTIKVKVNQFEQRTDYILSEDPNKKFKKVYKKETARIENIWDDIIDSVNIC